MVSCPTVATGSAAQAPTAPRRPRPWILVVVEETDADHGALVWALREAARREATVVAVRVLDDAADGPLLDGLTLPAGDAHTAALDDAVLRAVVETGIQGRTRTAVLDPHVFAALSGAARGADLVLVGGRGKTLLRRPAPPTHPRPAVPAARLTPRPDRALPLPGPQHSPPQAGSSNVA